MSDLTRKGRRLVPLVGDMLFSVLTIPLSFTALEKWTSEPDITNAVLAVCAMYAAMGAAHLFRAFRLRESPRAAFIAHLTYGVVFMACAVLAAIVGLPQAVMTASALAVWAALLADRALAIARRRKRWSTVLNVLAVLLILLLSSTAFMDYSIIFIVTVASLSALTSVMIVTFSRIKLNILREIVRKTYAAEIISGLLLLIVAFSYMLKFTDKAFSTFGEALWYCFAVVTTIGFGDLTPTTSVGRLLSVILGLYGIIVVALITSIIVNFYGEMKKESAKQTVEKDSGDDDRHPR